jgi:hypothetical protein
MKLTRAQFWGTHLAATVTDETGAYIGDQALVWTGSNAAGNLIAGSTCNSWTAATGSAAVGLASDPAQWLYQTSGPLSCAASAHVYCLGKQ